MKKLFIAAAVVLLSGCSSNTDIFNPSNLEKEVKADYAAKFAQAYPNVNLATQSWDFSRKYPMYSLPGTAASGARTRAENYTVKTGGDYIVDQSTLDWMHAKLVEQRNNRALGSAFYMKVPANSFTIVPIYQGEAALSWDLHMVVNGVDILVWSKSQNVWVKQKADDETWKTVAEISPDKELKRTTIGAAEVKATQYVFDGLPAYADMYFYLKVTGDDGGHASSLNAEQSSLDQMMLALDDCPVPANLPEGNEVMIVGCEDLKIGSDWDMNDLVFMIYGKPDVPKPEIITEDNPVVEKKTVRYMIEDLGSTDDFDFNDIVIDVSEYRTTYAVYTNGILTSRREDASQYRQEAVIRHLGGVLPFKLTIGNTELPEHQGVLGSNPDEAFAVEGWDINTHNIKVEVENINSQKVTNSEKVYNTIGFPKKGEAPMIIAVDPTQQWMNERVSVPESWFYVPE